MNNNLLKQRPLFEDLIKRRFIYTQSFEIYGGVSGFFDYGPIGSGLKNNLIQLWRKEFVNKDDLLEISTTNITPEIVFKNSGHLSKFTDLMVLDTKTKLPYRADKIIEETLNNRLNSKKTKEDSKKEYTKILSEINGYDIKEINNTIKLHEIKSKENNDLGEAFPFNLMFQTKIGPLGNLNGYLKPETAQGMFLNFKRLLEFNLGKLPFGSAQVGLGFRNEISPRNSLLRVREFEMGEIEFFYDPKENSFPDYNLVKDTKINILSKEEQINIKDSFYISIEDMMNKKYIKNEILAYYLAKTYNFLLKIGIKKEFIRFRQHLDNEMAHYSSDCWDAEIFTSYGWVECVGHADRSAFDLECHTKGSGVNLKAARKLNPPVKKLEVLIEFNKSVLGKKFKKESSTIINIINNMSIEEKNVLKKEINENNVYKLTDKNSEFVLDNSCFKKLVEENITVHEEKFTPHVIEPSFGFGRILYAMLEHSFIVREGEDSKRTFLKLNPLLSPIKVVILPLLNKEEIIKKTNEVYKYLKQNDIMIKTDMTSLSIGKRYARTEEIGIPFGITIDHDTLKDETVTLRESESMSQIRIPIKELLNNIIDLSNLRITFNDLKAKYPIYEHNQ